MRSREPGYGVNRRQCNAHTPTVDFLLEKAPLPRGRGNGYTA